MSRPGEPLRVLAAAALLCAAASIEASDSAFTLLVENDKFTGSDNNFSNGVGISWSTGELHRFDDRSLVRRWAGLWDFLPFIGEEDYENWASWTLGQEMHTPDDITDPDPPLDDQPYAGVLYLDSTFHARRERWWHTWNVRLGVVGPASQADTFQRWFHDLIDADKPRGWSTQLPNEPLVNLDYTAGYIWHPRKPGKALSWRLVPNASIGAGNYFTGASVGLFGEAGWNLTDALGVSTLHQGFGATPTVGAGPQDRWSVSLFAGAAAYAVGHYLPLDGTVFRDSHSVDSTPVVGLFTGGLSLRRGPLVLTLAATYFTETFETERAHTEFGTLSFSWYY